MLIINETAETEQIGGNWACVIGCGAFCIMGGGIAYAPAAIAAAL